MDVLVLDCKFRGQLDLVSEIDHTNKPDNCSRKFYTYALARPSSSTAEASAPYTTRVRLLPARTRSAREGSPLATIEGPAEVPDVDSIDAAIDISGVIQFARGRTVGTITVTTYDRSEFS